MKKHKNISLITAIFIVAQLIIAITIMLFVKLSENTLVNFFHNLLFYLFVFILPTVMFISKVLHNNPVKYLNLKLKSIKPILIALAICAFITVIFSITNKFQYRFDKVNPLILAGTILAGVFEEIPFRGLYQPIIKKKYGFIVANIITSLLFMSLHIKLFHLSSIPQLIMLFFTGLWLGYIYEKTESIWAPIMVHATFNFLIYIFRI